MLTAADDGFKSGGGDSSVEQSLAQQSGEGAFISAAAETAAAPVVGVGLFAVFEFAAAGRVVGTVQANDPDGGTLTFRLLDEGNIDMDGDGVRPFSIESGSGRLLVNDHDDLDLSMLATSTFFLRVAARDSDGLVGQAGQIVNIIPALPAVTVEDVSAEEGGGLLFTVTLDRAVANPFDVHVQLVDNTASGGPAAPVPADYLNSSRTLSFVGTAGESHEFNVSTTDDAIVESNETFSVALDANSRRVNDTDTATGTIENNDTAVLSISDVVGTEGSSLVFSVTLDADVQGGLDVGVQFADGSATGGSPPLASPADFSNAAQSISFAGTAGEVQTFAVPTLGDALDEGSESFTASLATANPAVDASAVGTGTISNNRPASVGDAIGSAALRIAEGSPIGTAVGSVPASDADGDILRYSLARNANPNNNFVNAFQIDRNTGVISVADPSDLNFEVANRLRLNAVVTETPLGAAPRSFVSLIDVDITNVNEAPRINRISPVVTQETTASVAITGVDPDNGHDFATASSFTLVSLDAGSVTPLQQEIFDAKLVIDGGNLYFNEFGGQEKWLLSTRTGSWFFVLPDSRVFEWDNQLGVLSGRLVGSLAPSVYADPTVITADVLAGPQPRPQDVPIPTSNRPSGTFSGNQLNVASNGYLGSVVATVRATDPGGLSDTTSFTIIFADGNRPPVIAPIVAQTSAPGAATINVPLGITDPDGDSPIFLAARLRGPVPARLTIGDGTLTITRNTPFFAAFEVIVTANDGRGGQAEQTFQARFVPAAPQLLTGLGFTLLGFGQLGLAGGFASGGTAASPDTAAEADATVPPPPAVALFFDFNAEGSGDPMSVADLEALDEALRNDAWHDDSAWQDESLG